MDTKTIGKYAFALFIGVLLGVFVFFLNSVFLRITESPELSEKVNRNIAAPQNGLFLSEFTVPLKVRLPKGSRLYIDETEIKNKQPVEGSSDELFIIGNVWQNTHKIKVTNPIAETLNEEIYISRSYRDMDSWISLYINKNEAEYIRKKAVAVISNILYSAGDEKDFSEVKMKKDIPVNTLQKDYDDLAAALRKASISRHAVLKGLNITNIADASTPVIIDLNNVKVTFFIDTDYLFSLNRTTIKKESETLAVTIYLTNTEDVWEVNSFKFTSLPLCEE